MLLKTSTLVTSLVIMAALALVAVLSRSGSGNNNVSTNTNTNIYHTIQSKAKRRRTLYSSPNDCLVRLIIWSIVLFRMFVTESASVFAYTIAVVSTYSMTSRISHSPPPYTVLILQSMISHYITYMLYYLIGSDLI
jgi:hypothetical protein